MQSSCKREGRIIKSLVCSRHHEDGHLLWSKGWRDLFSLFFFSPAIDFTKGIYSSLDIWKKMRVEKGRSTPFSNSQWCLMVFLSISSWTPLASSLSSDSWKQYPLMTDFSFPRIPLSLSLFVSRPVCSQLSERRENEKGIMHMVCVGVRTSVLFYRRDPLSSFVRYSSRAGKLLMRTHFGTK